jgi:hypothetical protein
MHLCLTLIAAGALSPLGVAALAQATAPSPAQPQSAPAPSAPAAPGTPATPAPLVLQDLPADPHTPTPEEQAQLDAERQRRQIQQIAAAQNKWGPAASTPGMSLTLKEVARTKTDAGTEITYQLVGSGLPPGMKLTLVRWPLNQGVTALMDGISLDASGTAVCDGPEAGSCGKTFAPKAPIEAKVTVAKGEAVRLALIGPDKKTGAAASVVPFPIASEDKGCRLEVIRGSKNDELVLIQGDGFKPATNFNAGSESFGEKRPMGAAPNANGHFVVAMTPWVTGHDQGDTVIYAQTDTCSPTLSFHWGKDNYKLE